MENKYKCNSQSSNLYSIFCIRETAGRDRSCPTHRRDWMVFDTHLKTNITLLFYLACYSGPYIYMLGIQIFPVLGTCAYTYPCYLIQTGKTNRWSNFSTVGKPAPTWVIVKCGGGQESQMLAQEGLTQVAQRKPLEAGQSQEQ